MSSLVDVRRPIDGVVLLRLDRPSRRNAVDHAVLDDLDAALEGSADATVLVLGSTSPAAFSAGADLDLDDAERAEVSDRLYVTYRRLLEAGPMIVAALDGHVVGAGAQLALAADVRVAGPGLRMRFAGTGHGLVVGAWGLAPLVGRGRASELCATGRLVEAEEAAALGVVEHLAGDAESHALALAEEVAGKDPDAIADLVRVGRDGLVERLEAERARNAAWTGIADDPRRERG